MDFEKYNRNWYENRNDFKAGDVVSLKSGGMQMTVIRNHPEHGVLCAWTQPNTSVFGFNQTVMTRENFEPQCLKIIK